MFKRSDSIEVVISRSSYPRELGLPALRLCRVAILLTQTDHEVETFQTVFTSVHVIGWSPAQWWVDRTEVVQRNRRYASDSCQDIAPERRVKVKEEAFRTELATRPTSKGHAKIGKICIDFTARLGQGEAALRSTPAHPCSRDARATGVSRVRARVQLG